MILSSADILRLEPAPSGLETWVRGFVHRRDRRGGDVVLILPETRSSIQIRRADPYFIRERSDGAPWRRVPDCSLWGPRLERGYGYAARDIEVFGAMLTPAGYRSVAGAAPATGASRADDLFGISPKLAGRLVEATGDGDFDRWRAAAAGAFRDAVGGLPEPAEIAGALDALEAALDDGVGAASARLGLSERHFRRLFRAEFGAPPKTYARLLRFDRTLRALHPRPWEAPAGDGAHSYADQAHLIREFCAFAEITPGAYRRNKARSGDAILRSVVVEGVAPPDHAPGGQPKAARSG